MKLRTMPMLSLSALGLVGAVIPGCQASVGESVGSASSALGSSSLVVSQVYGGGGNSGATYTNDYVELFNRGTTAVSVDGWSVQYASSSGNTWLVTNLSGTIQPGHYYLVQEAQGAGGTTSLPTPDAVGSTNMSASTGKVALVNTTTHLTCSTSCLPNSTVVDFVGYGSYASSYEGSGPAPTLNNTSADLRAGAGCTDTDNNAADFSKGGPLPRNSATASVSCGGGTDAGTVDTGVDTGTPDTGTDTGTGTPDAGAITLPSPTLPPTTLTTLSFGVVGDTRPSTITTGSYPTSVQNIINGIFTGLQGQGVPLVVGSGDYAFSNTSSGSAVPQYNDYMSARSNYAGRFLPTMGNHECDGYTADNCPLGSYTGMMNDYLNLMVQPSTGQTSPFYSALYLAADGSWSAKFIFIAANAWTSAQDTWLQQTLAVNTTYTFTIRHEPSNDTRAPGTTPSETLMASSFNAGKLTLSLTGHTHLVQLPNGTQPYGDPYGSTTAYEIIVGNGGAPLDAGPAYGYAVATRRASDGAIVTQMYESADASANPIVPNVADTNFRFAVNANGTPNSNTTLP